MKKIDQVKIIRQLPTVSRPESREKMCEGRVSVDSAYYENSLDDLKSQEFEAQNSGSNKWIALIEVLRQKRKKELEEGRRKGKELDLLRSTVEKAVVKSRTLESQITPVREKLKHSEDLLTGLETKIHQCHEQNLTQEKLHNEKILQLKRNKQTEFERESIKYNDMICTLKEELRKLELKNEELSSTPKVSSNSNALTNESNEKESKVEQSMNQLASLRTELLKVRQVLDSSERDRLKERKEKLVTLQNMIRLTKEKSDLEESLDELQRNNTQENSMKYVRLFEKHEACMSRLKKLETEDASEQTEIQKKYLNDVRNLESKYEGTLREVETKYKTVQLALTAFKRKKEDRTHELMEDLQEKGTSQDVDVKNQADEAVIEDLEIEGIHCKGLSGNDLLAALFSRYKDTQNKLKIADEILNKMEMSNARTIIETLKEEKLMFKRKLDDATQTITAKDSELRIADAAFKRQIEDLLNEKKKLMLECNKHADETDQYHDEILALKERLAATNETLSKRTAESATVNESLMSVTNEMNAVDGDLGKTRREIQVKDAEITRLKQDLSAEQKLRVKQQEMLNHFKNKTNGKNVDGNHENIVLLEEKIRELERLLENSKLQVQLISTERDKLQTEVLSIKDKDYTKSMKLKQLEDKIETVKLQEKGTPRDVDVKNQNIKLEELSTEKTVTITTKSIEVDRLRTEVLATQHLLSEAEDKVETYLNDIETLTVEMETRARRLSEVATKEESEQLQQKIPSVKSSFSDMNQLTSSKMKDTSNKKTSALNHHNIEEATQQAIHQNEVQMSAYSYDDFLVLDEKPASTQDKNTMANQKRVVVDEDMQNEVDWLMQQSQPIVTDQKKPITGELQSRVSQLETENSRLWNDSLQKDTAIKTLQQQLELKENEKQSLEEQLERRFEETISKQSSSLSRTTKEQAKENENEALLKIIQQQLTSEIEEKEEAMDCLKSLVIDNENLSNIIKDQQRTLRKQQEEHQNLKMKFNQSLDTLGDHEDSLVKTKEKLRNVMQTSLTKESNIAQQQKREIEQYKEDIALLREEKRQLQLELDDKSYEVRKTQDDLNTLRSTLEYNLGSMETEKRSKEFIEDQMKIIQQDRGHTQQKLQSSELLNKILQNKLMDLQKWHNSLEISLLKTRDFCHNTTLSPDTIKTNQTSPNGYLDNQLNIINNKLYESSGDDVMAES